MVVEALTNFEKSDETKDHMSLLERVSVQALCKFMCVSSEICQENLDILVRLMQFDAVPSDVKQTIVCAIGDLWRRFTNMIEDRTEAIYNFLKDNSAAVRQ